jgi:hypothetical protein
MSTKFGDWCDRKQFVTEMNKPLWTTAKVDLKVDFSAPSSSEARNAALEEAAKAMCCNCAKDLYLTDDRTEHYWIACNVRVHVPCGAAAIRSLQRPEAK